LQPFLPTILWGVVLVLSSWGSAVWPVVHVDGVLLFSIVQPDARRTMVLQSEMDPVVEAAFKKLSNTRAAISGRPAEQDQMFDIG
jgi:hypothetical protein